MVSLDISIVFFCIMIDFILTIFGLALKQRAYSSLFFFFSMLFGIFTLGYFISNYTNVVIGTFTIPFDIFIVSWVLLCILVPLVLILRNYR